MDFYRKGFSPSFPILLSVIIFTAVKFYKINKSKKVYL